MQGYKMGFLDYVAVGLEFLWKGAFLVMLVFWIFLDDPATAFLIFLGIIPVMGVAALIGLVSGFFGTIEAVIESGRSRD